MKLSIIIAFYESHGVVERQVKHFAKMNLPDDIEFILVDDGSNPPHEGYKLKNLTLHHTNDKRPWTQAVARNAGAKLAKGEYLFFTDIDHILSKEAIMDAYRFTGDRMLFPRYYGVLLEDGTLTQDLKILKEYGVHDKKVSRSGKYLYASYHGNTFVIKKKVFEILGGFSKRVYSHHPPKRHGDDSKFNAKWGRWARKKGIKHEKGSPIYLFPIGRWHKDGDTNPGGLFHTLSYGQFKQPMKK